MLFGAIWWAWMSFTWFASAFDCMTTALSDSRVSCRSRGSLVLAAAGAVGVQRPRLPVGRARLRDHAGRLRRPVAAGREGTSRGQSAGVGRSRVGRRSCRSCGCCNFSCPTTTGSSSSSCCSWSSCRCRGSRAGPAHSAGSILTHIAERFGLFTLIVIGESITAATLAIQSAFQERRARHRADRPGGGGAADLAVGLVALLRLHGPPGRCGPTPERPTSGHTATTSSSPPSRPAGRGGGGRGVGGGHGVHLPEWGSRWRSRCRSRCSCSRTRPSTPSPTAGGTCKPVVFAVTGVVVLALTPLATVIGGPWTALVTALIMVALLTKELLAHPSEDARSRPAE